MRNPDLVYLGLGTNLGDRPGVLKKAALELSSIINELKISRFYESTPLYVVDQPAFLNAVLRGKTTLPPMELLTCIHEIEAFFGRDRTKEIVKGPRNLDIDILLFGKRIIRKSDLIIPHPDMKERKFVLLPLLDLDPYIRDPVNDEPYYSYLEKLPQQGIYYSSLNEYTAIFESRKMLSRKGNGGSAD